MNKAVTFRILFTVGCAVLLALTLNYRPIDRYIETVKIKSITADKPIAGGQEDELRKKIDEWKQGREEAPINAKVDRVWRAIPGYNGLAVNVEASLEKLKNAQTAGPGALVFEEIPPAISLEQLGAHPIYRGNPQKPAVSFMINVAWGNEYLDTILDTLDKHGVKTTFFPGWLLGEAVPGAGQKNCRARPRDRQPRLFSSGYGKNRRGADEAGNLKNPGSDSKDAGNKTGLVCTSFRFL